MNSHQLAYRIAATSQGPVPDAETLMNLSKERKQVTKQQLAYDTQQAILLNALAYTFERILQNQKNRWHEIFERMEEEMNL